MNYINKLMTICVLGVALISCEAEKRDQDVSGVGSTEDKPTASIVADVSTGEIEEGNAVTYTITLDKPIIYPVSFSASLNSTEADADDVELGGTTLQPYSTEGIITVQFTEDMWPEINEGAEIVIAPNNVQDAGSLLNGDFSKTFSYTIQNVNSTEALTVALKWNQEQADDIDMVLLDANGNELAYQATGDYPEINEFIPTAAPDGIYYISIQPYAVFTPQWEYTFAFSEPNGEVTTFSGVFDGENLDAYTADMSPTLGEVYRLAKIVKDGADFTITQLP